MMNQLQTNGFNSLDDFLESLITDEIAADTEVYSPQSLIHNEDHIPNSPTSCEIPTSPHQHIQQQDTCTMKKHKPSQLDSPGAMQVLTHSLENHSTGIPKNNFGMNSSVMYSPPLSPECGPINVSMKPEDSSVMLFPPPPSQQQTMRMEPAQQHVLQAAQQSIPQFISDKNFEKSYIYDPKPLTRKTRRSLVPDEQKNQKYWLKRMRNNVAARKSREDRRRKELEVLETMKALKDENQRMKTYIESVVKANEQLVAEMMRVKHQLQQYENNAAKLVS